MTTPNKTQHTPGFALVALLEQLAQWKHQGANKIQFGALASHPETDEGCTFGDLIEPARAEFEGLKQWGVASTDQALHEAAPELLAALHECVTDDGATCLTHAESRPDWLVGRIHTISNIARAAISKAEGRAE